MQKYSLIQSSINGITVYGISICAEDGSVYEYRYISSFFNEADELIKKMSKGYIAPVHFNDIVTDYLAQLYYAKLAVNGLA